MPPAKVPVENKLSSLLTQDENQQIVRMLGVRCQTLATSVVQLYTTQPPYHSQWMKRDTGVLCFVKDNMRKNYFFRIFCFKRNMMIWEQEMYNNMEYTATMPYLHTFEGDDCLVAFNFAEVNEAHDMKNIVDSKIMTKRKKEERRIKQNTTVTLEEPRMIVANTDLPLKPKFVDIEAKSKRRKRNLTKADIGTPSAFRHISHVGWDPTRGFDINTEDTEFADFFKKAGVSETELRDTETRKFIYDFIAANGVREAVATEQKQTRRPPPAIPTSAASTAGPPVPPRGSNRTTHSRVAPPPPPPTNNAPPRPPPTNPRSASQAVFETRNPFIHVARLKCKPEVTQVPSTLHFPIIKRNVQVIGNGICEEIKPIIEQKPEINYVTKDNVTVNYNVIPSPPAGNAPPPPPPPPLPTFDAPPSPPPIPRMDTSRVDSPAGATSGGGDIRSALLASIRDGTKLKPVEDKKPPVVEDPRGDLLSEIRKGFQLKPCNERDIKPVSPTSDTASDLAGALARALAERNKFIHSDSDGDDTSDTESDNDDEWDA